MCVYNTQTLQVPLKILKEKLNYLKKSFMNKNSLYSKVIERMRCDYRDFFANWIFAN